MDETRNYLLDEIKHNDLMSEMYKRTCKYLNYARHLLLLASTINGFVLISAFATKIHLYNLIPLNLSIFHIKY